MSPRDGAAVVEVAVIAPVLLLMIFACFEFLRFEFLEGMAKSASYEAARVLMVPGAVKQDAINVANEKMALAGASATQVIVRAFDENGEQTEVNDGTWAVSVQVEIPLSVNMFSVGQFVKQHTIRSTTLLTSETYDGYYDHGVFE